jgi:2,4-diaminopentanoate dehydrogenase
MPTIAVFGAGQLGTAVAAVLRTHGGYSVLGPYTRAERQLALSSGTDVVIIATTTRFRDVAADVEMALQAGSNVLVSAEECAYPFAVDRPLADRLSSLAVQRGVSIAGCGVNPGLIFDALVLTLLGASPRDCAIEVRRTVDISGFGSSVLRRIGIGRTRDAFQKGVADEVILGHAGFPQSMAVVASAIGVTIDRIDKTLLPVITNVDINLSNRFVIACGESAGVDQTYTAFVDGTRWFTCQFFGHVDLARINRVTGDDIDLLRNGAHFQRTSIRPAIGSQTGSQNMVANSVARILEAPPGWVTVAQMRPAYPAPQPKKRLT